MCRGGERWTGFPADCSGVAIVVVIAGDGENIVGWPVSSRAGGKLPEGFEGISVSARRAQVTNVASPKSETITWKTGNLLILYIIYTSRRDRVPKRRENLIRWTY
jgi:hypothetical protein